MRDRIPLFNSKNNVIKFDLSGIGSWSDFVIANDSGLLRADVYSNNDGSGTLQIGSVYSVANVLPNALTARLALDYLTSEPVDALNALADSALSYADSFTLLVGNWLPDGSLFKYIITDPRIKAHNKNFYLPALGITPVELDALQRANLQDGGQTDGNATLIGYGEVPPIDIPMRIIFGGTINA